MVVLYIQCNQTNEVDPVIVTNVKLISIVLPRYRNFLYHNYVMQAYVII